MEKVTRNTSRISRSPSFGEENETFVGIKFPQVIEEIYKLLPEDKFPRKENSSSASISKPKSSVEEDIVKQESPSVSLPQSHLLVNTMNFIQDQIVQEHKEKKRGCSPLIIEFGNPVDQNIRSRYYTFGPETFRERHRRLKIYLQLT